MLDKVDWDAYNKATEVMHAGRAEEALWLYQTLNSQAEPPDIRAAVLIACAGCYARIGRRTDAFRSLDEAHSLDGVDIGVRSQIDLAEAKLHLWGGDYQLAAKECRDIGITYASVLSDPEHQDFAQELKSQYAYALTFLGSYADAIPLLKELVASETDARQHSLLYLGICLVNSGAAEEGRKVLLDAAQGDDEETRKEAMKWLAQLR